MFSPENGFSLVEMHVAEYGGGCYAVKDPAAVQSRVELCNGKPVFLMVHARRDSVCDLFASTPQQSDYVASWSRGEKPPVAALPPRWKNFPIVKQLRHLRLDLRNRQAWRSRSLRNRRFYSLVDWTI